MSKLISLSKKAYEVLLWAKLKASEDEYSDLTHSGAVLWMKEKIKQLEKKNSK